MRKLITVLAFLLLLAGSSSAVTVTIGTGTSTQRQPFGLYFGYERSAAIYTATEIGTFGSITTLAWYVSTAQTATAPTKIYLATTTATTLTAGTWADLTTGATLVYDATRSFTPTGWLTIDITDFTYSSGNLLVLCETNYGGGGVSSYPLFRYSTATSQHEYWAQDNSAPTGSGTVNANRPNIQMSIIAPPCSGTPNPGNTLSSANPACSGVSFTLSLQNLTSGDGVTYLWETSTDGSTWTPTTGTNSTYIASQTAETYYHCQVTCSGNTGISNPLLVTMNAFYNCYCTSMASSTADEEIYSVTVNGVTNAYSCTTVAPGTGSILNRYSNFYPLGTLFTLTQSTTANFTVEENECDGATYYSNGCAVWIDFNHDGDFTDAGEQVYTESATTVSPRNIVSTFAVPPTAALGTTGMRVTVSEGNAGTALTPCLAYNYGETEDYLVTIVENLSPSLSVLPNSINFNYCASGGTSEEYSYVLSGMNLTPAAGDITITPPANFEISLVQGGPYSAAPITVGYTGRNLPNTTVYAVFKPTTPGIPYSGNIEHSGGGATTVNVAVTGTSLLAYCASGASNTGDEEIYSVTIDGNTNAYDCSTVAPGPGSILNRYSNFTTLGSLATIAPGNVVSFTVEENECDGATYYTNGCAIWIDFNQNGVFTDPGEQVYTEAAVTASPRTITGTFTVPAGAKMGETWMRVSVAEGYFGTTLTPCLAYGYGETEDYIVTIGLPPADDVGTMSIDNVSDFVLPGVPIAPKATLKNFGLNSETFDVTMTTSGYTSTVTGVTLASGASTQVTFANWTPASGSYTLTVCTRLVGDMKISNDCKSKSVVATSAAWTSGAVYPTTTYMGTGTGWIDNSVTPPVGYMFSLAGNTTSGLATECYKYNTSTNTWTAIASLPVGRVVTTCAAVGNYLYLIGGAGAVYSDSVYRYDILADSWTLMPTRLPKAMAWGKATPYGTNYIYLAGGVDGSDNVISDVYLYDVTLDTWTAATSLPAPKFGGAFSRAGNKLVYVAGAGASVIESSVYVGTIDGTDPHIITWATAKNPYPGSTGPVINERVDDMAGTKVVHSGIFNKTGYPAGTMYRFDGAPWGADEIIVAAGSPTATWTPAVPNPCYAYNPMTDTWAAKPNVPVAVLGAATGSVELTIAGVPTRLLIVASGYTGSVVTTATQILTESFPSATPLSVSGAVTDVTGCYGNTNGAINITATGGTTPYTYLWSNLATTEDLTGIGAGTYTVTVTDATLSSVTGSWVVNAPPAFTVGLVPVNASCPTGADGSIDLTVGGATPAYTYAWSNLATTEDLTGLNPGNYTVTVTDANNCSVSYSTTVGQDNNVCANITLTGTVTGTECFNATNLITTGGTAPWIVAAGADVTLISGVHIIMQPGTQAVLGSHLHAYISTDYCGSVKMTEATVEDTPVPTLSFDRFLLFPNPTNGNFTLVQKGDREFGSVRVEIYGMNGNKVLTDRMIGEKQHEFRVAELPEGLYFVRVVADGYIETMKLVKTR